MLTEGPAKLAPEIVHSTRAKSERRDPDRRRPNLARLVAKGAMDKLIGWALDGGPPHPGGRAFKRSEDSPAPKRSLVDAVPRAAARKPPRGLGVLFDDPGGP